MATSTSTAIYLRKPIGVALVSAAVLDAQRNFHEYLGTEHLMMALSRGVDGYTMRLLQSLDIEPENLRAALRAAAMRGDPADFAGFRGFITPRLRGALLAAQGERDAPTGGASLEEMHVDGADIAAVGVPEPSTPRQRLREIDHPGHSIELLEATADHGAALGEKELLLAVLGAGPGIAVRTLLSSLSSGGLRGRSLAEVIANVRDDTGPEATSLDLSSFQMLFGRRRIVPHPQDKPQTDTPLLNRFGRDLTDLARQGKLPQFVGRKDILAEIGQTLSQLERNVPVLVGEPGVGKTAIVEGFAARLAEEDNRQVVQQLRGKRIVEIQMSGIVAGTALHGEFEERLHGILRECEAHPEVILFIDETHTLVGAGHGASAQDAAQILKPALGRGDLHVIGATTHADYQRYIMRDAALERRLQMIRVEEPSPQEAEDLLRDIGPRFEELQGVRIAPPTYRAAVELSIRHFPDRRLPAKAIDLLDAACANVAVPRVTQDQEADFAIAPPETSPKIVTAATVAAVIAKRLNIPMGEITATEQDRLLDLEANLRKRVRAQNEALAAVAESLRRSSSMVANPNRPRGVLLFAGPTGVGKTETARALAAALFGPMVDQHFLRIDMAQLSREQTPTQLIGSSSSYPGYAQDGQLTGWLRWHPYSLVLFDEFEKAHHEVRKSLLSLLEEGRLADATGRAVNGKQAVYILTTNLLAESDGSESEAVARQILARDLTPELVNRIDRIVVFQRLSPEALASIAQIYIDQLRDRLRANQVTLDVDAPVRAWIVQTGTDPNSGARELARVVERMLGTGLAKLDLQGKLTPGAHVRVTLNENALSYHVSISPTGGNA